MAANQRLEEKEKALQNVSLSNIQNNLFHKTFFLFFILAPSNLTHILAWTLECCVIFLTCGTWTTILGQGRGGSSGEKNATVGKRVGPDPV